MKTCRWCGIDKKDSRFSPCENTSDGLHSYCHKCLSLINELNTVVREGPREVKVKYPYSPWDKFLYAYVTKDYGCRYFEGVPKVTGPGSIPIEITHGKPVGAPGDFTENVFGEEHTIYFLLDTKHWRIKIGRTSLGMKTRLSFYTNDVEVLGILENQSRTVENSLHHEFAKNHLGSEWFAPTEELLLMILDSADFEP